MNCDEIWVEETLAGMSVEEKVGQTLFPRIFGYFLGETDETFQNYVLWIRELHVGGLEIFFSDIYGAAFLINRLQEISKIPLLIGCDAETGMGHRIAGTTHLTHNMGLGATGNEHMAWLSGKITALEGRAVGMHIFEGPTVDVNVNPDNPIIAVRSFGDDPEFVGRMGQAYIRGVQDHGMIACAKHFPGHGNTTVDSHMDMPVIEGTREMLEKTDLLPFRMAMDARVMGIMTAHLHVPAFDPDLSLPATLSRNITTGLLREDMGFEGIIMSDAMKMDGITKYFPPGEAELQSFLAGTDILLVPFLEETWTAMIKAVESGRLPIDRLDSSVRRILRAKSWCGLPENRFTDPSSLHHKVGAESILHDARALTRASVTLLKNEGNLLPIRREKKSRILSIVYYDHPLGDIGNVFQEEMRKRTVDAWRETYAEGIPDESGTIRTVTLQCDCDPRFEEEAIAEAAGYDLVVCALIYRIIMRRNTPNLRPRAVSFMTRLIGTGIPVAAVSFGAPYVLKQIPGVTAFVASYMYSPLVQKATVEALFGEIPFMGKLPLKRL